MGLLFEETESAKPPGRCQGGPPGRPLGGPTGRPLGGPARRPTGWAARNAPGNRVVLTGFPPVGRPVQGPLPGPWTGHPPGAVLGSDSIFFFLKISPPPQEKKITTKRLFFLNFRFRSNVGRRRCALFPSGAFKTLPRAGYLSDPRGGGGPTRPTRNESFVSSERDSLL